MLAILTRYFGLPSVEIAEDIVQDTLIEAMENWSRASIPQNPEAWLMDVAKKKMINFLRRHQHLQSKIIPALSSTQDLNQYLQFDETLIRDSTLRMIFACCHPTLSNEAQIALALKSLCGLSIPEIASALLTRQSTVNKRLYRAKQKFRKGFIPFEIPDVENLSYRLNNVFQTLYLLFNEGYYSAHPDKTIRMDFCFEAVRLLKEVMASFPNANKAKALLALMLFSIARMESRIDAKGGLLLLAEQDRSQWDTTLIAQAMEYLQQSIQDEQLNTYQLQAGIAAEHCLAPSFQETNWESIYQQYKLLIRLQDHPITRFNQAIAQFYYGQRKSAIQALLALQETPILKNHVHYQLALGIFHQAMGDKDTAALFFQTALSLVNSEKERHIIKKQMRD